MRKKLGLIAVVSLATLLMVSCMPAWASIPPSPVKTGPSSGLTLTVTGTEQAQDTVGFGDGSTVDATQNGVFVSPVTNGVIRALSAGTAVATVGSYGLRATTVSSPQAPTVKSLAVTPDCVAIGQGRSQQLAVAATMSDGTTQDVTAQASYESSNSGIVMTTGAGILAGLSVGTATVTVSCQGQTAQVFVTVASVAPTVQDIKVTPTFVTLSQGQSRQLAVTTIMSDGVMQNVTAEAGYESGDSGIVSSTGAGTITGVSPGTATLTVSYQDQTAHVFVTVAAAPVLQGITVTPAPVSLGMGQSQQLAVTATMSDGTTEDVTAQAGYESSDSGIVSSTGAGSLTGVSAGTATVTVSYQGQTAHVFVIVASDISTVQSITVTPQPIRLSQYETQQLSVMATMSDCTINDVTSQSDYTSSDSQVAWVSKSGMVMGANAGNTNIDITCGGVSVTVPVTVTVSPGGKQITKVTVSPEPVSTTMIVNDSKTYKFLASFDDGSVEDVSSEVQWTLSNKNVTVNGGTVTALSPGSTAIKWRIGGSQGTFTITVDKVANLQSISGAITNQFSWLYNNTGFKWSIGFPLSLISYDNNITNIVNEFDTTNGYMQHQILQNTSPELKSLIMSTTSNANGDYVPWTEDSQNLSYLGSLVSALNSEATAMGYDKYQTADFVAAFVESIPNQLQDTPSLPGATLAMNHGDCASKSILLIDLLKGMGYHTADLYFSAASIGEGVGHMTVGVAFDPGQVPASQTQMVCYPYSGVDYYEVDTTYAGYIGEPISHHFSALYPVR